MPHTPTPWEVRVDRSPVETHPGLDFFEIVRPDPRDTGPNDPNRCLIADMGCTPDAGENAALIVRSVNSHAALVAVVERLIAGPHDPDAIADMLPAAEAALALARKEM